MAKLVLSHDPVLGGLDVASNPWETLMELDLGMGHHPILLDEAMAALPETPVQLEVKNWPADSGFEHDHRIALEVATRGQAHRHGYFVQLGVHVCRQKPFP